MVPGRVKQPDANEKLFTKTKHKQKLKTLDRSELLTGSKESLIELFKTPLFRTVYYEPFCTLWREFAESLIDDSEETEKFMRYLDDIKEDVEGKK